MLNYVAKMQDDSNHSYDSTRKPLKKEGVTLIELLIAISLMGFIFALGIHPMLSQSRMINAERDEIILFDEANLAVFYITKDAMEARTNDAPVAPLESNTITFEIVPSLPTWTGGVLDTAEAYYYIVGGSQS